MIRYIFRGGVGLLVVVCVVAIAALAAWGTPSSTTTTSSAPSSTTTAPAATTTTNPCHTTAGTCLTIVPNCPPGSPRQGCNSVPPCVLNDATQTPCDAATTAPPAPDSPRASYVEPTTIPVAIGDAVSIVPTTAPDRRDSRLAGAVLPATGSDRPTRTRILQAVAMFVIVGAGLVAITRRRAPA